MIARDTKTGRMIGKPKIQASCLRCSNNFECYESHKRIYCSYECYWQSRFVSPNESTAMSEKERYQKYKHKEYNKCLECNQLKSRRAKRCITCKGKAERGENNKSWKGGIDNHLAFVRQRYLKLKEMENHSVEEWNELKRKFNYMCLCCKQQEPFIKLTRDHIVPLSRGGNDLISNIQPLCKSCNSIKMTKTINFITQLNEEKII